MADIKDIPLRPASRERDLGGETPEISEGFLIISDLLDMNKWRDSGFVVKEKGGTRVYMHRVDDGVDVRITATSEVDSNGNPLKQVNETYLVVGSRGLTRHSYKSIGEKVGWAETEITLAGESRYDFVTPEMRLQAAANLASKLEAFFATPEAANSQK